MNDKMIRVIIREMLQEMLEDDVPAVPSTGRGGKCNCESSYCQHDAGFCANQAGAIKAQYVGALCDDCGAKMPKQYLLTPPVGDRRMEKRSEDRRKAVRPGKSRGPGPRRAPGPRKPGGGLPWRFRDTDNEFDL